VYGGSTQQSPLITSTRSQMVKCAAGAGCSIIFSPGRNNCSSWHFLEYIHKFIFVAHLKFLHKLLWIIGVENSRIMDMGDTIKSKQKCMGPLYMVGSAFCFSVFVLKVYYILVTNHKYFSFIFILM
jgi:hypothetical protein